MKSAMKSARFLQTSKFIDFVQTNNHQQGKSGKSVGSPFFEQSIFFGHSPLESPLKRL